jgi:hypothetical protein
MELKMRIVKAIYIFCAFLALTACKVDTSIDVFTTDLLDASNVSELATPSVIKIEVSGCEKNKNQIMDIAEKYFEISSAATCSSSSGEEYVEFSAQTPIIYNTSNLPKNIVTGILVETTDTGSKKIFILVDKSRFSAMENDVKDMDSTASLKLNNITINLNHDGQETIYAQVPAAFIDNAPVINGVVELNRRESAKIVLSDVGVSLTATQGRALVLEINQ